MPAQLLIALFLLTLMLFGILLVLVGIFQIACRLAGLERPGYIKATWVVFCSWLVWTIAEAVIVGVLREVYTAAGSPWWEVGVVAFFIGLPLSLAAASLLHVALLRVSLSKAIQVWFVERLIRFSLILLLGGLIAAVVLAAKK